METVDPRQLAEHVQKAVVNIETAPKAKHVRGIVLYTWNTKNSQAFWQQLLLEPVFSDEIVCFKSLIVIHKLLRDGHPIMLKDTMNNQSRFFDYCVNQGAKAGRAYSDLIRAYVAFIKTKLEFHRSHPDFKGNMDYSDYLSLKKSLKPDESWETVLDLLKLQGDVLEMASMVFKSFKTNTANECRISSLVPIVEESNGIYQFLLSMLRAMHANSDDISVFEDLRDKFNDQHRKLQKFYYDCSSLRYLTSLIPVPDLDANPPSLYDSSKARGPMRSAPSNDGGADFQAIIAQLNEQLRAYRERYEQDQARIAELFMRNQSLEHELGTVRGLLEGEQHRNAELQALLQRQNEEYGPLKTNFLKLQELYTAMRNEHLPLLQQKQQFEKMREQMAKAKQAYEQLQKANQAMTAEKTQYDQQLKTVEESFQSEIERLRRLNKDQSDQIQALGASKGAEFESLLRSQNEEKAALEQLHQQKTHEIEQLRQQLNQLRAQQRQQEASKDEEISVLQVGLDESLERMHELQQSADAAKQQHEQKLRAVLAEQANEMKRLLDDVLEGCARKVEESAFQFESPLFVGNTSATAEAAALSAERASAVIADFAAATQSLAAGGSPAKVLSEANNLASAVESLVSNAKGALRIAGDDSVVDEIGAALKAFAKSSQDALLVARPSGGSATVDAQRGEAQRAADQLLKALESLMVKDVQQQTEDIGDLVDREMQAAAKAIEEAALRLHELMRNPKQTVVGDFNVNQSILQATMGITSAIGTLIRAATLAQQEIVAKGRGSATSAQFYKKNHRWTEGLVSAAKAVAMATTALVESADAVVRGTQGIEPLVVAAHEVAAATAQLVAASRVKADRNSTTQSNLEGASKAVSDATKLLVAAAKEAALKKLEENDKMDLTKMSMGQVKRADMEQQVKILTLEKELTNARRKLADMRKASYHAEVDEAEATTTSGDNSGPVSVGGVVGAAGQALKVAVGVVTSAPAAPVSPVHQKAPVSPVSPVHQKAPEKPVIAEKPVIPAKPDVVGGSKPAIPAKPSIPPKPAVRPTA